MIAPTEAAASIPTSVNAACTISSPVGWLRLVARGDRLVGVRFERSRAPDDDGAADHPVLREAARQLAEYFAGARRAFDLPLAPEGNPFQRLVWDALLDIPFGRTSSYGELARRIGRPDTARAVGAANGANPIAILVPCHRVIGADGSLTGYGGGLGNKRWLLRHEGALLL